MSAAARIQVGLADPRSGPASTAQAGRAGHFHFAAKPVYAEHGKLAGLARSNYIRRVEGQKAAKRGPSRPSRGDLADGLSAERTSAYIRRDNRPEPSEELGAYVLIPCGLPVTTGPQLARALDAAERKPDGTYRCYGGRLPRVAFHYILSFRYGVTPEQAGDMLEAFACAVSNRVRVPVEGQVHNKDGRPDHAHLLIGTRVVEGGVLGRKCRALDAVSEKADGDSLDVGGRRVGATIEWMRSEWARGLRDATGDLSIDHRSYARRGIDVKPVSHVSRADIEYERRRGTAKWRDRRRRELALRESVAEVSLEAEARSKTSGAPGPGLVDRDAIERRAAALLDAVLRPDLDRHGSTANDVGAEMAASLGIDMPGRMLVELVGSQRQEGSRRAEHHPHAEVSSDRRIDMAAAGADSPTAAIADQLADVVGLDVPGSVIERLLKRQAQSRRRDAAGSDQAADPAFRDNESNPAIIKPVARTDASRVHSDRTPAETRAIATDVSPSDAASPMPPPRRLVAVSTSTSPPARDRASMAVGADARSAPPALSDDPTRHRVGKPPTASTAHVEDAGASAPLGPDEGMRQGTSPAETAALRGSPDHGREVQLRESEHPDLQHVIAAFRGLAHARRLSVQRVEILATTAGLDRQAFVAAVADAELAPTRGDVTTAEDLPPHLSELLQRWNKEDNAARRANRAKAKAEAPVTAPKLDGFNATTSQASAGGPGGPASGDHNPVRARVVHAEAAAVQQEPAGKQRPAATEPASKSGPPLFPEAAPDQPAYMDGASAVADSDMLAHALVAALTRDVRDAERRKGKVASSTPEFGIAMRLRALGRDRDAVEVMLTACATQVHGTEGPALIARAVAYAFSGPVTKRLNAQPRFVERIRAIEGRTEAHIYRVLRRQALDGLRRDLDAVWAERRMRADEATQRHAQRLQVLYGLQWSVRRARHRRGLMLALVSALVELAVLRPLIARQKQMAAAERLAITEAARRASNDLKRLRQEWRTHVAEHGGRKAVHLRRDRQGSKPPTKVRERG